ncbi:MAG TPA: hypothetical protein VLA19_00415, partial [Herpetosiphonaceae bacterium]|nr:hypothetical protein [Herpetosiphonaceae bacterium]
AYFHALRYRPEDPEWEGRDRFLLSIGHYAIALYAVLIEAGIVPTDELETYGTDDSRLPMSGMAAYTPGMEISGGSLGIGLGIAVGMCLGLKRKGSDRFVYTRIPRMKHQFVVRLRRVLHRIQPLSLHRGKRGKTCGGQAGWQRPRTRSGRYGMTRWPGMPSRSPR